MQISGVIPFIKLQKQYLSNSLTAKNDEKWDVELNHLSVFVVSSAWNSYWLVLIF